MPASMVACSTSSLSRSRLRRHSARALDVPTTANGFGLTASYFLGPEDAWVVKQNPGPNQPGPSPPATGRYGVKVCAMLRLRAIRRGGRHDGRNRLAGAG
jgi:hypothetical protein